MDISKNKNSYEDGFIPLMEKYFSTSDEEELNDIFREIIDHYLKSGDSDNIDYFFFKKYFFSRSEYLIKDTWFLENYFSKIIGIECVCDFAIKEGVYHFVDLFYDEEYLKNVKPEIQHIFGENCILLLRYLYEVRNEILTGYEKMRIDSDFTVLIRYDEMAEFYKTDWVKWKNNEFPIFNIKPAKSK